MGLSQGVTIFVQYILGDPGLVGILSMATLLPMMAGMLFVEPIIKKFGKINAMIVSTLISLIGSLFILVNPGNLTLVIIATIIKGVGSAPLAASLFAMLADTNEYGEWKSGVRTEGLVYSAGSFGSKVGIGLGTGIVGWILSWGGYVGGKAVQTDSALFAIHALYIYIPIALTIIQIVLLWLYKLDKEYPQIMKDLQARSAINA